MSMHIRSTTFYSTVLEKNMQYINIFSANILERVGGSFKS
jgi:hypothetical protein